MQIFTAEDLINESFELSKQKELIEKYYKYNSTRPAYLYCHICKITKKIYIGQTVQKNLNGRFRNGKGYTQDHGLPLDSKFSNAINKYGWNNFIHRIICIAAQTYIDDLEQFYIAKYSTTKTGYNIDSGGNVNKVVADSTKEKHRQQALGHKLTQEARAKISAARKACKGNGFRHSEKTKQLMSVNNARSAAVSIIDLSTGIKEYFTSIRDLCTKYINFKYPTVVDSIRCNRIYLHRYIIRKEEYNESNSDK